MSQVSRERSIRQEEEEGAQPSAPRGARPGARRRMRPGAASDTWPGAGSRILAVALVLLAAAGLLALVAPARADEGMWLFTNPPRELLKGKYGFSPSPEWMDHLMHSSCRVDGASGSFVSADGLILTNHHVGSDAIYELSTPENDLLANGFVAHTFEEELRCPGMEVLALGEIVDVTARVKAAVPPGANAAAALAARDKEIALIEQESKEKTGLESEVVTLYRGALYHLYRYERYEDVRLVMAPENAVAFFGLDRDNFEYPRFDLDICLLRAYEHGKPAKITDYLRVSPAPVQEGDLVFVAGHPASTQRLMTVDHLRYYRDVSMPLSLDYLWGLEIALQQFSLRNAEYARMAQDDLLGVENGRKERRETLAGLLDPSVFAKKAESEALLRANVAADPSLGASLEDWDRLTAALQALRGFDWEHRLLEGRRAFWSDLYRTASILVRLATEKQKPNAERLEGYRESDLEALEHDLFSPAPIYPELEQAKLAHSLTVLATSYGAEHPLVQAILQGKSPRERAAELVTGSKLADVDVRRRLAEGGMEAIAASTDPMIALARTVDPYARALRKKQEDLFESVEHETYEHITRALFAEYGTGLYPDATGTLRFGFGPVRGIPEEGVNFETTLGGMFARHDEYAGGKPYTLPERWLKARGTIDPATQLDFICTADITGGNSGSPLVDREGRLVGVIFDGNLESFVWDYAYTDERGRSVAVGMPAILEALRKVYGAGRLAEEMTGR